VGLPRRSGLDLGLSLSPNSLIWMREIPRRASLSASHLSTRRSTICARVSRPTSSSPRHPRASN
jgi:hypothetical protein